MVDFNEVHKAFSQAALSYSKDAHMQNAMGDKLIKLIPQKDYSSILEIGCGPGNFTSHLLRLKPERLVLNDLSEAMLETAKSSLSTQGDEMPARLEMVVGNIESKLDSIDGSFDLIVSNATLQWIEDLNTLLERLCARLNAGGVLAFSTFGPQNFYEIREVFGSGLKYKSMDEIVLPRGMMELHKCEMGPFSMHFKSMRELFLYMRSTGVNGVSKTQVKLKSAMREYEQKFKGDSGLRLTWQPFYIVALKQ